MQKTSLRLPKFNHRVVRDLLWFDNWYNCSRRRLVILAEVEGRKLCAGQEHGRGRSFQIDAKETADIVALLKACAQQKDLLRGTRIHAEILKTGLLEKNRYVANSLLNMYAKCGELAKAARVLGELPAHNLVSWNALLTGYVQQGQGEEALKCFERMQREGLSPDAVTFTCILKACGRLGAAEKGQQIHDEIVRQGLLEENIVLGTALVDMYAKCGALVNAHRVLNDLPVRNVVSWSALIAGYAQKAQGEKALKCFEQMQHEGLYPNAVTFACILKACGSIGAAEKGQQIHDEIIRQGLLRTNIMLGTALVDMYAKCGAFAKAEGVLYDLPVRNVISWSALIAGYAQRGHGEEALKCFGRMRREGLSPDAVTFACILKACGSLQAAHKGQQIHEEIVRQGLLGKDILLGTALVDMYAKCGALDKAERVLNELPVRNVVSWNALITGYAQQGQGEEALRCYELMQNEGLFPDAITFASILKACGSIGATHKGQQIHDEIVRQGLLGKNLVLGTALVDMYVKCGALGKARQVFDELPARDVVSLNALIAGYAQQGYAEEVLNCFKKMEHEGLSPSSVTLACVLIACSHSGLLDEGQRYFGSMRTTYSITPNIEHYACMVDLFSRAGDFDMALAVMKKIPSYDCLSAWSALLGACQKWENLKVGQLAFEHAVQVDKADAANYVCMANIIAAVGMQEDADKGEVMSMENEA